MTIHEGVVVLLLALPFAALLLACHWQIKSLVASWAARGGLTVLESRRRLLPPLRLLFTTSKAQSVVRIKVYDNATHHIRSGWLRLGSYWWGLMSPDHVEVFWDDR